MPTPKFEVTIQGIGSIINQFCRSNPDILRVPLSEMCIGDEYEWQRKPYNSVHFSKVPPHLEDRKLLLVHEITLALLPGIRGIADALEAPGVIDKMPDDWVQLVITITR